VNTPHHPVIVAACKLSGQTLKRFLSKDSKRDIAEVRQAACHVLDLHGFNQSEIGRIINRHHSSVQYNLRTARSLLSYKKDFIALCHQIKQQCPLKTKSKHPLKTRPPVAETAKEPSIASWFASAKQVILELPAQLDRVLELLHEDHRVIEGLQDLNAEAANHAVLEGLRGDLLQQDIDAIRQLILDGGTTDEVLRLLDNKQQ
jgi:hypothetical protein